jgi:hypothetical protein
MKLKALLLALLIATAPVVAQRNPGNPVDHLPANQEILTHFGERADFSPDNQEVAFMSGSFGNAFVINLKTREIRCLTCGVPGAAFLRVMHLANGDYILMGPEKFTDIHISRTRDNELWYLSRKPGSKPVRLGNKMSEGAAISKKSMKISFSELPAQFPDMPRDSSRLVVAELDLSGAIPKLINRKVVYESHDASCHLEAQDFYDDDTRMTFTCYNSKDLPADTEILASAMGIDLTTGKVVNFSNAPTTYNECEGIFADGKYTCIEGDRHVAQLGGKHGSHNIDIYKLKLDGTGKDFVRLTHFNDFEGWKASNPVISTDGKLMAFQIARTADEAGVGYGLVLYKF